MSRKFVVIYEAPADYEIATAVADRVLVERVAWLEEALLESQRQWVGEDPAGDRLTWKSIPRKARDIGIRVHGHFAGEPGLPDAHAARRAIAYLLHKRNDFESIILIRDADDQIERRQGLEQARALYSSACPIVLGVAICERESWVICGFEPQNANETAHLNAETKNLGFNPCHRSEELTAGKDNAALRSPKRVLSSLTQDNLERQRACWLATNLDILRERGRFNGLAEYIAEVQMRLAPLISGQRHIPPPH